MEPRLIVTAKIKLGELLPGWFYEDVEPVLTTAMKPQPLIRIRKTIFCVVALPMKITLKAANMTTKPNRQIHKTKRFQRNQIELALSRHFPNCPPEHSEIIIKKAFERDWNKKTSLTKATSIVVHNHIRHHLTDYEELLKKRRLTRDEARLIVKPEVDDWFDYWHSGHDIGKPEPKL